MTSQRVQFVDCRWELGNPARGRELYVAGHVPGASFLDVDGDLSDPSVPDSGRHPLPSAERFAAAAGRAGIGADVYVVAYGSGGGPERLWWLLRHFGTRATNPPANPACGPGFTEIDWLRLYVELRHGRLTGFRYIEDGWPPTRDGKQVSAADPWRLVTTRGITLGSTLAQARAAYGHLRPVGTNRWQTPDGLILYDNSRHYPDPASSRITEIKYGTCGDF